MVTVSTRVLGIDAAGRHGWVGVVVDADGFVSAHLSPALEGVIAAAQRAVPSAPALAAIGVDIPIGLVDAGRRAADRAARAYVGSRRSSVFWAPHRSALAFDDQAVANAHLESIGMAKVSSQAMALFPRIREAARVASDDARVIEVFPEASFRAMAGSDLERYKKTAEGTITRLALLAATAPSIVVPSDLGAAGVVPIDDLFDAAAAAWSAWRFAHGRAEALGDPAEVDPVTGRLIAVWV